MMSFYNKTIPFSKKDISRKISIPNSISLELAEIMGVIFGDGHLCCGKKYNRTTMYYILIAGSSSEDMDYYQDFINKLFYGLFNVCFKIYLRRKDELEVRVYSKAISNFFKHLGIKEGNKVDNNEIPKIILISGLEVKKAFLRGVFDTESSISFKKNFKGIHHKPVLSINMKSKKAIYQISKLLEELNFSPNIFYRKQFDRRTSKIHPRYELEIPGKKNLNNFLKLIGFHNPRHLTKLEIWRRMGVYPPKLSYIERKNLLKGDFSLIDNYFKRSFVGKL